MSQTPLKRFYKTVSILETEAGWAIALDDRPMRTPANQPLCVPTSLLAEIIAQEWDRQSSQINMHAMTLTRMANVALDRTPSQRPDMIGEFVRYCETDLLCFPDTQPADLAQTQNQLWAPIRDWAACTLSIDLKVNQESLIALDHPPKSLEAARQYAAGYDDFMLTGLLYGTSLFGSALLASAVLESHLDTDTAHRAAILPELFQMQNWGQDEEMQAVLDAKQTEAQNLGLYVNSLKKKS